MNSNTMTNILKPKNPNPNIILLTIPWEGGITLCSLVLPLWRMCRLFSLSSYLEISLMKKNTFFSRAIGFETLPT